MNKLKKIMLVVTSVGCIISMSSCNKQTESDALIDKYFDMVDICANVNEQIFYDRNTGVMYFRDTYYGYITPIYNADGTLKIYERTNNETTNK